MNIWENRSEAPPIHELEEGKNHHFRFLNPKDDIFTKAVLQDKAKRFEEAVKIKERVK